ncbi:MAG: hypothetical protein ACRYFU_03085 [Janthinobacterium lividum]
MTAAGDAEEAFTEKGASPQMCVAMFEKASDEAKGVTVIVAGELGTWPTEFATVTAKDESLSLTEVAVIV